MKLQSTVCMAASLWGVWANAAPGDVKWSNAEDGPCTSGGAIDNAGVAAGDNGQIYFVSAAREWTLSVNSLELSRVYLRRCLCVCLTFTLYVHHPLVDSSMWLYVYLLWSVSQTWCISGLMSCPAMRE